MLPQKETKYRRGKRMSPQGLTTHFWGVIFSPGLGVTGLQQDLFKTDVTFILIKMHIKGKFKVKKQG